MPLLPGVFSIYSLDPKFIWLKQEMTLHIPGIGGENIQYTILTSL